MKPTLTKSTLLFTYVLVCLACSTYTPPSIPPTMVLKKEDYYHHHKLSDIVQSYRLIPLETNDSCLIGSAGKIIFDSTTFYVKDETSKRIYRFNMQGKFLNIIGKRGRGPFEHLHLDDYILTKDNHVLILDGSSKRIIIYNAAGKAVEQQNLPFFADAVEILNDSVLVFNSSSFEELKSNLGTASETDNPILVVYTLKDI